MSLSSFCLFSASTNICIVYLAYEQAKWGQRERNVSTWCETDFSPHKKIGASVEKEGLYL